MGDLIQRRASVSTSGQLKLVSARSPVFGACTVDGTPPRKLRLLVRRLRYGWALGLSGPLCCPVDPVGVVAEPAKQLALVEARRCDLAMQCVEGYRESVDGLTSSEDQSY